MKRFLILVTILALFTLQAPLVQAHLAGGQDAVVGEYLIDFGYEPDPVIAGKSATFAFNLVNNEAQKAQEYSHVWIRISSDTEGIIFAGNTHSDVPGNASMLYTFASPGEYKITTHFKQDRETIVQNNFTIQVAAAEDTEEKLTSEVSPDVSSEAEASPPVSRLNIVLVVIIVLMGIFAFRRR
jgi:hypothetical protein